MPSWAKPKYLRKLRRSRHHSNEDIPTGSRLVEILSWRRSRHTPARRSAPPRNLARSIARVETNMSTFECTRKLPQHEYAIVLFKNISISLLKKIRRPFELFEMKTPFYFSFSKTPPLFPTIARHGPTFPTTSYRSVGIGVWNILHFIFF